MEALKFSLFLAICGSPTRSFTEFVGTALGAGLNTIPLTALRRNVLVVQPFMPPDDITSLPRLLVSSTAVLVPRSVTGADDSSIRELLVEAFWPESDALLCSLKER